LDTRQCNKKKLRFAGIVFKTNGRIKYPLPKKKKLRPFGRKQNLILRRENPSMKKKFLCT
jgi:hypothetical protein